MSADYKNVDETLERAQFEELFCCAMSADYEYADQSLERERAQFKEWMCIEQCLNDEIDYNKFWCLSAVTGSEPEDVKVGGAGSGPGVFRISLLCEESYNFSV